MPRPKGIEEPIRAAQIKRLLEAGFDEETAGKIWTAYRTYYMAAWREYVEEGLIPKTKEVKVEDEPRKKPRQKKSARAGRPKEDHEPGISGVAPGNPADSPNGNGADLPAAAPEPASARGEARGTSEEEKSKPGSLVGLPG